MKLRFFFAVFALFMSLSYFADAQGRGRAKHHHNNRNAYYQNGYNHGHYYARRPVRRVYRQPANYCQPVPVAVYRTPRYYAPAPRVIIPRRPVVNINIGF